MSFDMTIRFDKAYSRSVPFAPLSKFLGALRPLRAVRPSLLVFDVPPDRHLEVSLEVAAASGDSEAASEADGGRVNCVRLHVPYAYLGRPGGGPDNDYYNLAYKLATLL